ncbi:hypothetical protein EV356DRAFT_510118, partial [Viridothelium virens]
MAASEFDEKPCGSFIGTYVSLIRACLDAGLELRMTILGVFNGVRRQCRVISINKRTGKTMSRPFPYLNITTGEIVFLDIV